MDNRIMEQFKLLKRAKKLEEMASYDRALELYLELHENYEPNTSDAYERPAILLERAKRYEEAKKMCEDAIDEINNDRISGTVDKFNKRLESINHKLNAQPTKPNVEEHYTFGIVGFRSKTKSKMLLACLIYIGIIFSGFVFETPYIPLALIALIYSGTFLLDISKAPKKYRKYFALGLTLSLVVLIMSILNIPSAFEDPIELEDSEAILENGDQIFSDGDHKDDEELPEITSENIEDSKRLIMNEIEIVDAQIQVIDSTITFALKLDPGTGKEKAIRLSEEFVDILAHQVANTQNIKAPGYNSLGELYEFYDIILAAGEDDEHIIARGSKNKNSKFITWRD